MPKTRRGGRKYQLRKIKAELYQPLPTYGFLHYVGIERDYAVTEETGDPFILNSRVSEYKLVTIDVPRKNVSPSVIPAADPRLAVYTTRLPTEEDDRAYNLVPVFVPRRVINIAHVPKDDPRYHYYASKQRVSAWIESQHETVSSEILEPSRSREE